MDSTFRATPAPAASQEPEPEEIRVAILGDHDIVQARQKGRELAGRLGFSSTELTLIATTLSELARNIVLYAGRGVILVKLVNNGERQRVIVTAHDQGPGIPDIPQPLTAAVSTAKCLGHAPAGVERLLVEI